MNQRKRRQYERVSKGLTRENIVFLEYDGTAEKHYLQGLHNILRDIGIDISFSYGEFNATNAKECINNLRKKKSSTHQEGDLLIAICDVDNFDKTDRSGKKSVLRKAIENAKEEKIHLLISNVCFEQWLEFHISAKEFSKDQIQKKKFSKLVKDVEWIKKNIGQAYKRAKAGDDLKLDYPTSYGSRVWQFIDILDKQFPEKNIISLMKEHSFF